MGYQNERLNSDRLEMLKQAVDFKGLTVLDLGCFPKGTLILNKYLEIIPIEEIKVGDEVLSDKGNVCKVKRLFKRKYQGFLYEMNLDKGHLLEATEEHPILGIKRECVICTKVKKTTCNTNLDNKCSMCGKSNSYQESKFIPIKELKKGDYIAIPRNIRSDALLAHELNQDKLARFLGWYLAEGCVIYSHKPHIGGLNFTLGITEGKYADEIRELGLSLGAKSVTVKYRRNKNTIDIFVYGKNLAELVLKLGGKGCANKKLDISVFGWSKKQHINLLQSYFLGDGHSRYQMNKGEQYQVVSVSKKLIEQVRLIFNKYGISPSLCKKKLKGRREAYTLTLAGPDISILEKRRRNYPSRKRYRSNNKYIFLPINKITKKIVKQYVYNLEVDKDHTYIANGICVHNCAEGYFSREIKKLGASSVVGVCENLIEEAKSLAKAENLDIEFMLGDFRDVIYPRASFDCVLFLSMLHYFHTDEEKVFALKVVSRLTKKYCFFEFEEGLGHPGHCSFGEFCELAIKPGIDFKSIKLLGYSDKNNRKIILCKK